MLVYDWFGVFTKCVYVFASVFLCGLASVQWDGSRFDFPRRFGQASSLSDSNLYLKRRENVRRRERAEKRVCAPLCVCVGERAGEGEDGMKVSWEKFAEKYEDTYERREQINKGCFP